MLVHILHCDPQKPNQPTVQWVLEAFRRVAPEPVGLVLEAGRYSGTLYAYLVSKLPEDAALQGWVRQYKAQAQDTQEFPRPIEKPTPQSEAPTAEISPKAPEGAPGPVTQLFRDFAPPAKLGDSENPAGAPLKATESPSPSFPQRLYESPAQSLPTVGMPGDSGPFRPAVPWDTERPRAAVPPRAEVSGSIPVDSFRPDFAPKTFPSETQNPPQKDSPKAGEFTSFFQGPFRGDRPLPTPAVSSQPIETPRKNVGDFTAMFGPLKSQPEEAPPAAGIAGNEPAGTGFTGWFTPDMPSRMSSTTAPPPMGLPRAVVDPSPVVPEPLKEPPAPPPPPMSYMARRTDFPDSDDSAASSHGEVARSGTILATIGRRDSRIRSPGNRTTRWPTAAQRSQRIHTGNFCESHESRGRRGRRREANPRKGCATSICRALYAFSSGHRTAAHAGNRRSCSAEATEAT